MSTPQGEGPVATLVVEDEPLIAEAHAHYLARIDGFTVAGVVHNGADALRFVRDHPVDLILLDFNLPDRHGLDVCRALRAARSDVDVIAVTSNRDLAAVRSAVSLGVVHYLLKPFTFAAMRDKLERYRDFRCQTRSSPTVAAQSEIDRAFAALRGSSQGSMPSGLSEQTLEAVTRAVRTGSAMSAVEVAASCAVSRVTARRYLEYLTDSGVVRRHQRHGTAGRPEIEYQWSPR